MRKILPLALCLLLVGLPLAGLAEESTLIFTGSVQASNTVTVTAPFGGQLLDFTLREGDRVDNGQVLMTIDTTKVYAPFDGTVVGVFAQAGDSATYVQNRYGALCYLEPKYDFTIASNVSQAYNDDDNRIVHLGETVYIQTSASGDKQEGVGRIISISGADYIVEVTEGEDLEYGDAVVLYREDEYEDDTRIGRGTVMRSEPVAITVADGSILSVPISQDKTVRRGDLLFEMVSGTLDKAQAKSTSVRAPQNGVVAAVAVSGGQNVTKGQALATLYRTDKLQLVSSIEEIDLPRIAVGDTVQITFDGIEGMQYEGTIASIAGMGTMSENYAVYPVYIDFTPDDNVRLGMSATAYLVQTAPAS